MRVEDLSFVADRDGKTGPRTAKGQRTRCFWNVETTDDGWIDSETGHRLALEYLAFEEASNGPGILNLIVSDMPRPLTMIETSFLFLIGIQAKAGRGEARRLVEYWKDCEAKEATRKKPKRT